jgi:hypothetical protein
MSGKHDRSNADGMSLPLKDSPAVWFRNLPSVIDPNTRTVSK